MKNVSRDPGPLAILGIVGGTVAAVGFASLVIPHEASSLPRTTITAERIPLFGLKGPDGGHLVEVQASDANESERVRFAMHAGPYKGVWCILNRRDATRSTGHRVQVTCIDPQYVRDDMPGYSIKENAS